MTTKNSLLNPTFIKEIIKSAKFNIEKDGGLQAVIFLKLKNKRQNVIAPILFNTRNHTEKVKYMTSMGKAIKEKMRDEIQEAVMLSDAYMLKANNKNELKKVKLPIREHPLRMECIVIAGRNKDRSKMVMGTMPYIRKGKSIFFMEENKILEFSSKNKNKKIQPIGLIDYLFEYKEAELLRKAYGIEKEKDIN